MKLRSISFFASHAFLYQYLVSGIVVSVPGPLFVANCVSGPHVFYNIGMHGSSEKGIDGSYCSVEFSCGVY